MSDILSSDLEDESSWILDLETALLDNCDYFKLRDICKGRPVPKHLRADVWKICLNLSNNANAEDFQKNFNDLFDLPNQEQLHNACCQFVASLPKDLFTNSIGLINDIESVLTYFSRKYNIPFSDNNGWLSILKVICCELKMTDRSEVYRYFTAISHRFLPSANVMDKEIFSIFNLLLQYHDPQLCSFLDTLKINPKCYAYDWFVSLFSSDIEINALVQLWDIYFLVSDPFLMFYLSLIVILNLKDTFLELKNPDKAEVLETIRSVLQQMTPNDVEDFYQLAKHYISLTPKSFIRLFSSILFGNGNKDKEVEQMLNGLCMPVSVHELLETKNGSINSIDTPRYFLVDCRPADQYNAGHLSSAYFLDSSLMISSPKEEFQTSVSSLLLTQQQALESNSDSAGEHICFLGSGNIEEDRIVHMIVAQFLQKMTRYVSMVHGGYRAIHDVLGPQCDTYLVGHNESTYKCKVCNSCTTAINRKSPTTPTNTTQTHNVCDTGDDIHSHYNINNNEDGDHRAVSGSQGMGKLIGKFSGMLKKNSSKVKEKLLASALGTSNYDENHAGYSGTTCGGVGSGTNRSYRDTGNIFSIDDDDEGFVVENNHQGNANTMTASTTAVGIPTLTTTTTTRTKEERIDINVRMRQRDFLGKFECFIVYEDGTMVPGCLLLTQTDLWILRHSHGVMSAAKEFIRDKVVQQTTTTDSIKQHQQLMYLYKKRALNQVIKITSRKKLPECLTFHYQLNDSSVEKDRYLVTQAGEAAKVIKIQVQKILDEETGYVNG